MTAPAIPLNINIQQANGTVLLMWDITAGADSYQIYRSIDGTNYTGIGTSTVNYYSEIPSSTFNILYYYEVTALSGRDESAPTNPLTIVTSKTGVLSLGAVRDQAQQRSDMVNSGYVTIPEWNNYINQSYFELYDLLINTYENYYVADPLSISTDGTNYLYALPNGSNYSSAEPFYKLLGVDCGVGSSNNAWVTLNRFNFIDRNRYVYPNLGSTYMGVFNLQYTIMGDNLMFIPTPSANQTIRIWYIPRITPLLNDYDPLDGVSGWTEYVIVDAAIKALQKQDLDITVLMSQKMGLIKRIEESALNRDAGEAATISDTRANKIWGNGFMGASGPFGGY